mmetsp:Transcript_233/g.1828  ORF Transcript_233/g.1828 Transcript_233/m.1828 type:complete len:245 (+) Transcript_233:2997-3731(+)
MLASALGLDPDEPIGSDRLLLVSDTLEGDGGFLVSHFASLALKARQSVVLVATQNTESHHRRVFRKLGVDEDELKHLHVIHALQLHSEGSKWTEARDVRENLLERIRKCIEGTEDECACIVFDSLTALGCRLQTQAKQLDFMHSFFRMIQTCSKPCSCVARAHRDVGDEDLHLAWEYEATYICVVNGLETGTARDVHGQILASSSARTHVSRHDQEWDDRLGFVSRFRYHLGDRDISFFKSLHQ